MTAYVIYALVEGEIKYVSDLEVTMLDGFMRTRFNLTDDLTKDNVNFELEETLITQYALHKNGVDSNIYEINALDFTE